jgi:UDP-N-acetylglucosamine acyltransferase
MSNRIHPTAVLGPQVRLGTGNVIGPYAVLQGPVVLGDDNYVSAFACIGGLPEVRGHDFTPAWEDEIEGQPVLIGSRNVFKEHVTVSGGWAHETSIGDDGFFMSKAHVNHDCRIGDEVTISAMVVAAGHVTVEDGANLGLGAVVHQRRVVPAGSMIGMQAAVTTDLPPYVVSMGVPARPRRLNTHRLQRLGIADDQQTQLSAVLLGGSRDLAGVPEQLLPSITAWLERRDA